jgi:hypothetical protein
MNFVQEKTNYKKHNKKQGVRLDNAYFFNL